MKLEHISHIYGNNLYSKKDRCFGNYSINLSIEFYNVRSLLFFSREWLLTKIVNGERASYSAPKFARMQERTRSQMLEDIVANLANHAETGQIPKPYRRGSWRPIGHMRPSSPLLDSVRDQFEGYLSKNLSLLYPLYLLIN